VSLTRQDRGTAAGLIEEGSSPKKITAGRHFEHDALPGVILEEKSPLRRMYDVHRIARIAVVERSPGRHKTRDFQARGQIPSAPVVEELEQGGRPSGGQSSGCTGIPTGIC